MRIEVRATSELTASEREHIRDWILAEFDPDVDGFEWADVDYHVLVWEDDLLVAHVEIVQRTGQVDGKPVSLGGIGGVVTLPEWRGHGLGSTAMKQAMNFMCAELGAEFGLLICDPDAISFYKRLGWEVVEGPLVFDQRGEKMTSPDVTMVAACGARKMPRGVIDLCGPPW